MQSNTTTFLLLEDDPNDVFFVEHEFKSAPAHIKLHSVRDGVEAIEYLEGKGKFTDRHRYPLPDIILLDLKMPRLNGFDFLQWLRHKAPDNLSLIPAIVMSSSAVQSDIVRCYQLGANSYIVKPVNWDDFRKRIKALGLYWTEHSEIPHLFRGHH